jgi:cyclopropane fatty-acyl-phospholipid synthase-like methyltransferase
MIKENEIKIKLDDVKNFWNDHPCGSDYSSAIDRKKYFEEIEIHRYTKIRSIIEIADFDKYSGKKVLEIGCGVGTDGIRFMLKRTSNLWGLKATFAK